MAAGGGIASIPAALLIARFFFFQPFDSPSLSMAPSINQRDYFLVSLRAFAAKGPERGDVIVFRTSAGDFVNGSRESRAITFAWCTGSLC